MEDKSTSNLPSTPVYDELVLADEELKRLATIFDVLIDVDFCLKHTKGLRSD